VGVGDRITWTGMLSGDLKWGAFYSAEVFVLPSHTESFGVVVAEALACGLPVLVSNKVKIWREITIVGAGLAEDDTYEGTVSLLEQWLALPNTEQREMAQRARDCFLQNYEVMKVTDNLVGIINRCTSMRAQSRGASVQ
jgi:glycosyltransferase involved in cell wall biosynthesis